MAEKKKKTNKRKRGFLTASFQRVAIYVLAGAATFGGLSTQAHAQTSPGASRGGQITYTESVDPARPWANDSGYLSRVEAERQRAETKIAQERADLKAAIEAKEALKRRNNAKCLEAVRKIAMNDRYGTLEKITRGNEIRASYATKNDLIDAAVVALRARAERDISSARTSRDDKIQRIEDQFQKDWERQQRDAQRAADRAADRADSAAERAQRDADRDQATADKEAERQRKAYDSARDNLYKKYSTEEAKAGRLPDTKEVFFERLEEEQAVRDALFEKYKADEIAAGRLPLARATYMKQLEEQQRQRDAVYQRYVDTEVRAGRVPDTRAEHFKKLEDAKKKGADETADKRTERKAGAGVPVPTPEAEVRSNARPVPVPPPAAKSGSRPVPVPPPRPGGR